MKFCASGRGDQCALYRKNLLQMCSRDQAPSKTDHVAPTSHINYRFLSTPQKIGRIRELHRLNRLSVKKIRRLQSKIQDEMQRKAICIDESTNDDLVATMAEEENQVLSSFPDGSFQRIFWEQQKKAAAVKNKHGIRWHPLMIKWCIYLRHMSGKAYETLRQSGVVLLPSQRTLRDYSHSVKAEPGFSQEVDHQLMEAAKVMTSKEWEKLVVILLDEMYIRDELVYEKHSGTLVGFVNLGDINNHLLAFQLHLILNLRLQTTYLLN